MSDGEIDTADPAIVPSIDVDVVRQFAATATSLLGHESRGMPLRQTLRELCRTYVQARGAGGAAVMLVDEAGSQLRFAAGAGLFGTGDTMPDIELGGPEDGSDGADGDWHAEVHRTHTGRTVDVEARAAHSTGRDWTLAQGIRSLWITPLLGFDGRCLGTFSVGWVDQPGEHEDDEGERWLFDEFGLLAVAIVERRQSHWQRIALVARERERIAGELHDDSVQAMTAVSLRLQRLRSMLEDPDQRDLVADLRVSVDDAIERLRHMLFSLASPTLEEDGLAVTLEIYLETYVGPTGLAWDLVGDEHLRFSPDVEALAFRLARGALINVLKHAEATKVEVTLTADDDELVVTIADDGVGFDVGGTDHRDRPGHVGLSYAYSLATAVGGTYDITSRPGEGTTVTFRLPLI